MSIASLAPNPAEIGITFPEEWVAAHGDCLFHYALGQVRDTGVAEELVQDTFLAAYKARHRFSGRATERTWLVGILRHKICDQLRQSCRERRVRVDPRGPDGEAVSVEESVLWVHEVATECQSPTRRMELEEFRVNLERALGTLPSRLAEAFQMSEVEERSSREVCERLNVTEGNLWVMLHRARKHLRGHLAGWWHGEMPEGTGTDATSR